MSKKSSKFSQTRWDLSDLFPSKDSPEMQAAIKQLDNKVAKFEKHRSQLSRDIAVSDFLQIVKHLEEITHLAGRISSFAGLWFTEDTQDQDAQAYMSQIDQKMASLKNRALFFDLWWKDLEDESAEKLLKGAGDYVYWLQKMRLFKPHTLTEPEEKIINIKDVTGVNALGTLYDSITNRYSFHLEVNGKEKELTRGELSVHFRSSDRDLRASSYQELYGVYGEDGSILGQIYQNIVRDWRNEQVDLRHFANPIAARNLANDIPDDAIDTLLEVSQRNVTIFQRYFNLKARWLGVDRLRRYDIYAPVVKSDKEYPFAEATEMVLGSFERFDPRFANLAERIFDENHLDSEVRKGKRSGAFCWSVTPDITPWVMLNYQGKPDDVETMAHELGHAIHTMLAEDQTTFTFHASLPLAETASTFGEMLLVEQLLAEESDENVRRDVLFRQVDDAYATIMRQIFFALFERDAHELIHTGSTVDVLADAYLENLGKQFGDSVEVSDEFRWEWVSIPHIYQVPFYVYAYAFGQLLVFSLYQQYKEEGEAFKAGYVDILSAGGSRSPEQILSKAGIDVHDQSFWQGGFDVIDGMLRQLEEIPVEPVK